LARLELPPSPDLILLDLIMPKMDCWEFRTAQQQDPILAKIPVVLITAVPEGTDSLKAAGCVHKPVQLSRLLEAVERAC
jgi:two-component system response regulator MprA